ncbi:MAG: 2-hydroxyacyl-CoA dehydratase [Nitrospinae bacterium]|nr:2-hydroxyacyl-CoA dehydratase [Nitrospinota bacterium]
MANTAELEGVKEIEQIIGGMGMAIQGLEANPSKFKSDRLFFEAVKAYYERLHRANLAGEPIADSGLFVPVEVYRAMDIPYFLAEYHSILLTGMIGEGIFRFMDIAESYGLSNEICSPHRVAIGLAKSGMIPRPSFAVSTATSCDQTLKLYENLANVYGIPAFLVDSPYGSSERDLAYARTQVKKLIAFLEEQTGKKLDLDRLREVIAISKQCYDYWEKICDLRKSVPCPIGSRDSIKDFGVLVTSAGTPQGLRYFQDRYQEIKARVDQKLGAIPNERHRVAWLYVLPLFDLSIADWMEQEFEAVLVVDTMSYASDIVLDPSDPIDYLAKKPLKSGFIKLTYGDGGVTGFSKMMAQQIRDYRADVAMMLAHWSCRQYCATAKMLRDDVTQEAGVPFLIVDGDLLDSRVVSGAQMRNKISEFFKTLGK